MSKQLHKAIKSGDAEGVHDAIQQGAIIDATDKKGKVR